MTLVSSTIAKFILLKADTETRNERLLIRSQTDPEWAGINQILEVVAKNHGLFEETDIPHSEFFNNSNDKFSLRNSLEYVLKELGIVKSKQRNSKSPDFSF